MTTRHTTITPLASYRNETPYPFCPGCGHGSILDRLNEALVKLQLDPRRVVLVSDIGCSGLSDQYFQTGAFHGLHGRSITYASGIKLARPDLKVIVVMGDGGTGIGGTHLLNAARRNLGITVLVFNNFNFGMTGGQHSTTTPLGAVTSTTPEGNLERPLDICATVAVNGASYVYRGTSFEPDLAERIAEAIDHEGFSLLDIWELCTAHYVPRNRLSRRALYETLDRLQLETGVLARRQLDEYAAAYRRSWADLRGKTNLEARPVVARFDSPLERRFRLVVAGSAGGRVRSAARLVGEAALLSGLWAAQRDDYPITVKTGHSISELILSPEPIGYTGVTRPDALLLLTADGWKKSVRYLEAMSEEGELFVALEMAGVESRAHKTVLDLGSTDARLAGPNRALACLAAVCSRLRLIDTAALEAAVGTLPAEYQEKSLAVLRAGFDLT